MHRERTVTVKNVTLGQGRPKVFVPITGATTARLLARIDALVGRPVDVVEWRADHFVRIADVSEVVRTAGILAERLASRLDGPPLLFTCRTYGEGGLAVLSSRTYTRVNIAVAESGTVDLLDVEYGRERGMVERIIAAAHERGVPVITSSHDFHRTPPADEIITRLLEMQRIGADVCKVAVMPHSAGDVLTLLEATATVHEKYADRPLITMAMGGLGIVTRLAGQVFGSAATFGMVGTPSAPGQIDADELDRILRTIERSL